jgi:hypothetical protein
MKVLSSKLDREVDIPNVPADEQARYIVRRFEEYAAATRTTTEIAAAFVRHHSLSQAGLIKEICEITKLPPEVVKDVVMRNVQVAGNAMGAMAGEFSNDHVSNEIAKIEKDVGGIGPRAS